MTCVAHARMSDIENETERSSDATSIKPAAAEERKPPPPRRPSHADVIENLDRWANSPGLQPPKLPDQKTA